MPPLTSAPGAQPVSYARSSPAIKFWSSQLFRKACKLIKWWMGQNPHAPPQFIYRPWFRSGTSSLPYYPPPRTSRDLGVFNDPLKPHLLMNLQRTEWRYSTHVRCTRWPREHRQSPRSSSNEWTDQARSHPTYNVCFSTVECYCQWSEPRVWPTKKRGGAVWNKLKQIYRTLSFSPQTRRYTKGWFNLHIEIGGGFSWWAGKRGRWTTAKI